LHGASGCRGEVRAGSVGAVFTNRRGGDVVAWQRFWVFKLQILLPLQEDTTPVEEVSVSPHLEVDCHFRLSL